MANCETCQDTGFYGDNGAGIKNNNEYQPCDQCSLVVQPMIVSKVEFDYMQNCTEELETKVERLEKILLKHYDGVHTEECPAHPDRGTDDACNCGHDEVIEMQQKEWNDEQTILQKN